MLVLTAARKASIQIKLFRAQKRVHSVLFKFLPDALKAQVSKFSKHIANVSQTFFENLSGYLKHRDTGAALEITTIMFP